MEATTKLSFQEVINFNKLSPHLKPQLYQDIKNLSQSSPQIISRQATLNIGVVGHVAHGKSSIIEAITGVKTAKFSDEIKEKKTKRLGYANAKIYKCPKCEPPNCYQSYPSNKEDLIKCPNQNCQEDLQLVRHVSFCDCPGHNSLMSTMLAGASIMDTAIFVIAANEPCPQPQTRQHLAALEILSLQSTIIIQNKIDLIKNNNEKLLESQSQIKKFVKDSSCEKSPIIQVSTQTRFNIGKVLEQICKIPIPKRNLDLPARMTIIRSFDVNRPSTPSQQLQGGVVGGSLVQGILQVGMEVEILPGIEKQINGKTVFNPIKAKIKSLKAQTNNLLYAVPGGLIGVQLDIDSSLTKRDNLVGQILGKVGTLPKTYKQLKLGFYMMKKLMGADFNGHQEKLEKIKKLQEGQKLKFNIGSNKLSGKVKKIEGDVMIVKLQGPVCVSLGEKASFSRKIFMEYRLIGFGKVIDGK